MYVPAYDREVLRSVSPSRRLLWAARIISRQNGTPSNNNKPPSNSGQMATLQVVIFILGLFVIALALSLVLMKRRQAKKLLAAMESSRASVGVFDPSSESQSKAPSSNGSASGRSSTVPPPWQTEHAVAPTSERSGSFYSTPGYPRRGSPPVEAVDPTAWVPQPVPVGYQLGVDHANGELRIERLGLVKPDLLRNYEGIQTWATMQAQAVKPPPPLVIRKTEMATTPPAWDYFAEKEKMQMQAQELDATSQGSGEGRNSRRGSDRRKPRRDSPRGYSPTPRREASMLTAAQFIQEDRDEDWQGRKQRRRRAENQEMREDQVVREKPVARENQEVRASEAFFARRSPDRGKVLVWEMSEPEPAMRRGEFEFSKRRQRALAAARETLTYNERKPREGSRQIVV